METAEKVQEYQQEEAQEQRKGGFSREAPTATAIASGNTDNGEGTAPASAAQGIGKGKLIASLKQMRLSAEKEHDAYQKRIKNNSSGQDSWDRFIFKTLMNKADKVKEKNKVEDLKRLYIEIQRKRIIYLEDPAKMFDAASGSREADTEAHQIVEGSDIDYRVMRLAALFEKEIGNNDRFAATMSWLSANALDKKEMEYRYKLIRGTTLEDDLKNTFGEDSLQYLALKQIYDEGGLSKSAELALELGLLYKKANLFGSRMVHKMDDDRVRELIKESPEKFTFLNNNIPNGDAFEKKVYSYMKKEKSGLFDELRRLVQSRIAASEKNAIDTTAPSKNELKTGNKHADYLISLAVDTTNPYIREKQPGKAETIRYNYREFDKHKVTSTIFNWAEKEDDDTPAVPIEELQKFVDSGRKFLKGRPVKSPYTKVWEVLSEASSIRSFSERKIIPSIKRYAGFTNERLEFIIEWVQLIKDQREADENEKEASIAQGVWEIKKIGKLKTLKESVEKDLELFTEEKETSNVIEGKGLTSIKEETKKEMELYKKEIEKDIDKDILDIQGTARVRQEKKDFNKSTEAFPLKKLELLVKKQQTKGWNSKREERTNFKYKVLNLLSATKKWDPQLALIRHYLGETAWKKYEAAAVMHDYDDDDNPVAKTDAKNIFEEKNKSRVTMEQFRADLNMAFENLKEELLKTKLEEHQIAQIKGMVFHRGAFENKADKEMNEALHYPESEKTEKDYNTANYQKLKKAIRTELHKKISMPIRVETVMGMFLKAKPNSIDQYLILNDPEIVHYIKFKAMALGEERANKIEKSIQELKEKAIAPAPGIAAAFKAAKGQEVILTAKDIKEAADAKKNKDKDLKAVKALEGKSDDWKHMEAIAKEIKEGNKEIKEITEALEKKIKKDVETIGDLKIKAGGAKKAKEYNKSVEEFNKKIAPWVKSIKDIELKKWNDGIAKPMEEIGEIKKGLEEIRERFGLLGSEKIKKSISIIEKLESDKDIQEFNTKMDAWKEELKAIEREKWTDEKAALQKTGQIKSDVARVNKDAKKYTGTKEKYEETYTPYKKVKPDPLSSEDYAAQRLEYWANMLVMQYHSEKHIHDRNRLLELTYKAQQEEVSGARLGKRVREIDENAYKAMTSSKKSATVGEDKAVETLNLFLEFGIKIKVYDLLEASLGRKHMENYTSDADAFKFAYDEMTDDELLTLWFGESMKELEQLAKERASIKSGSDEAEMKAYTKKIANIPMKINAEIEEKFHEVAKSENKVFEAKRKIFEKLGKAFIDNKTEKMQQLELPLLEKVEIGMRIMAENNIKGYKQTQTGAAWHFWNAAGMVAASAEARMLHAIWEELPMLKDDHNNPEKYKGKEENLANIGDLIKKADLATGHFRDTQDRLNKQLIKMITTTVKLVIGAIGVASGQIYAPLIIKMGIALGDKIIGLSIEKGLQAALGREGELDSRDVAKDVSVKLASTIVETAIAHSIKFLQEGVIKESMLNGITDTAKQKEIKDSVGYKAVAAAVKTGFAIPKKEFTTLAGKVMETIPELLQKNPGLKLLEELEDYSSEMPKRQAKNVAETATLITGKALYGEIPGIKDLPSRPKTFGFNFSDPEADTEAGKKDGETQNETTKGSMAGRIVLDVLAKKWALDWVKGKVGDFTDTAAGTVLESKPAKEDKARKNFKLMEPEVETRQKKYEELWPDLNPDKIDEAGGTAMREILAVMGISIDKEVKKPKDVIEELQKIRLPEAREGLKTELEKNIEVMFEVLETEFPSYKFRIEQTKEEVVKKLKDLVEKKKEDKKDKVKK